MSLLYIHLLFCSFWSFFVSFTFDIIWFWYEFDNVIQLGLCKSISPRPFGVEPFEFQRRRNNSDRVNNNNTFNSGSRVIASIRKPPEKSSLIASPRNYKFWVYLRTETLVYICDCCVNTYSISQKSRISLVYRNKNKILYSYITIYIYI